MQRTEIHILDDFVAQAARRFADCCSALIDQRAHIHVGLTGGETARAFYRALAQPEILAGLNVRAIDFYESDERPVPPSHADSNWGMAATTFLDAAGVPEENRHRMPAEASNLDQAAREYEALLRSRLPHADAVTESHCRHGTDTRLPLAGAMPSFDLLLLGMGADGHTASLFPGTAGLTETVRLVVANPVPAINATRLTTTYPLINASRAVWIMASGERKAQTAQRAIEQRDPALPVTRIAPSNGPLVWLLDRAAAGQLSPNFNQSSQA